MEDQRIRIGKPGDPAAQRAANWRPPFPSNRREFKRRLRKLVTLAVLGGVSLVYLAIVAKISYHGTPHPIAVPESANDKARDLVRCMIGITTVVFTGGYLFFWRVEAWLDERTLKRMLRKRRVLEVPAPFEKDFEDWAAEICLQLWQRGGTKSVLSEWFNMIEMLGGLAVLLDNPLLPDDARTRILNRFSDYAIVIAEAEQHYGALASEDERDEALLAAERLRLEQEFKDGLRRIEGEAAMAGELVVRALLGEEACELLALLPDRPVIPD
jgi:hypothetical protein